MKKPVQEKLKTKEIIELMNKGCQLVQYGKNDDCKFKLESPANSEFWEIDICSKLGLNLEKEGVITLDCFGSGRYYFFANNHYEGDLSLFDTQEKELTNTKEQQELTNSLKAILPFLDKNLSLAHHEWIVENKISKGQYDYVLARNSQAHELVQRGYEIPYEQRLNASVSLFIDLDAVEKDLNENELKDYNKNYKALKDILIKNGYTEVNTIFNIPQKAKA